MRLAIFLCASVAFAVPAFAQEATDPLAPIDVGTVDQAAQQQQQQQQQADSKSKPPLPPKVIPKDWAGVLLAIGNGDWEGARLGINALPDDPLKPYAKAELYTAKGSPTVDLPSLQAVLAEAPELPQAEQLARMAWNRGAAATPWYLAEKATVSLGSAPGRYRANDTGRYPHRATSSCRHIPVPGLQACTRIFPSPSSNLPRRCKRWRLTRWQPSESMRSRRPGSPWLKRS